MPVRLVWYYVTQRDQLYWLNNALLSDVVTPGLLSWHFESLPSLLSFPIQYFLVFVLES